jgi:flagellar FliL protein
MAENQETPQEKSKGSKLWILITVLILVVTGDLTFRALNYFSAPRTSAAAASTEGADKKAEAEKARKHEVKGTMSLDPFLVNLADKESVSYVKATFQLGLDKANAELESPVIAAARDAILSLLSAKTADQILSLEGKTRLREEIRDRVNAVLPESKVLEVYIVDFVVSQ